MTESNTPHLRAKLPVDSLDGFFETFGQFILPGRMFLPTDPSRLKSVGDSIQFEVLLSDGSRALAGKGIVRQVRSESEATRGPAGMVVEYTHLSKRSKALVKDILRQKKAQRTDDLESTSESPDASESPPASRPPEADEPPSSLEETTERADPREEADIDAGSAPERNESDTEVARPETDGEAADRDKHQASETDDEHASDDTEATDDETLDEMAQTGFDVGDDSEVSVRESEADDEEEDAGGEFDELGVSAGAEAALFGDDDPDDEPSEETEAEDKQTKESGLQVLPYDEDDPDSPEDALSELDFGEDSDVDRMLDNMFSGGGDESELDEDEAADALFAEAFDDEPASERKHQEPDEPASERKHQEPGSDNQPDAETPDSEAVEADDAEDTTTADELSALAAEAGPDSKEDEEPGADLGTESTERADVDQESNDLEPVDDTENDSGELDEAFRALDQNDEERPKRRDLKLSIDEEDEPEEAPDDDSLDALIADTQQELQPVSSESEDDQEEGDALDKVLGDDLPEPPSDEFEFDPGQDFRPSGARKNPADDEAGEDGTDAQSSPERESSDEDSSKKDERKGFLSRFFGGDDD